MKKKGLRTMTIKSKRIKKGLRDINKKIDACLIAVPKTKEAEVTLKTLQMQRDLINGYDEETLEQVLMEIGVITKKPRKKR